jgi:nitroreductase
MTGTAGRGEPVASAYDTWSDNEARALVADAVLAPSVHNTQPWRMRLTSGGLELHADRTRALPVIDARHQALEVSCGAALFALRLSAEVRLGRRAVVGLRPDPTDPHLLAVLRPGAHEEPGQRLRALHAALPSRVTYRGPFLSGERRPDVLAALGDAAAAESARLVFPDETREQAVLDLVREAEFRWVRDPAYRAELRTWTGREHDGVPASAWGARDWRVPRRDFSVGSVRPQPVAASRAGTVALLLTPGDGVVDHLRAGQALMRVLLEATAAGVAVTPLQQAVERPYLRTLLPGAYASAGYTAQLVLCLGAPTRAWVAPRAPRRPVQDVLEIESAEGGPR